MGFMAWRAPHPAREPLGRECGSRLSDRRGCSVPTLPTPAWRSFR